MHKILLVEDEESIRSFLKINLKRNNYEIFEASSGERGLEIAKSNKIEVAILDVMLPGIDGYEVCHKLREMHPSLGIIMLTAKGQDMDKIMGLEYGADDYIVKPFNPLEVVLRVKALLRRVNIDPVVISKEINSGRFKVDLYSKKVFKGDEEIDLTPKEYLLMKVFVSNPNRAFTRDELLDLAWGKDFFGDSKIIDVNIRRLRSKIEDFSSEPSYIETVWGVGYRWKE
ncbi:MAG: response regulator transcription factor [Clostridium sp.]